MEGKAKAPRFQCAGTFVVNPTKLDNAYDEFVKLGLDVTYGLQISGNKRHTYTISYLKDSII